MVDDLVNNIDIAQNFRYKFEKILNSSSQKLFIPNLCSSISMEDLVNIEISPDDVANSFSRLGFDKSRM